MKYEIITPSELGAPKGWNHGMLAPAGGRILFVAGQTCHRDDGGDLPDSFVDQFGEALDAVVSVVRAAGGNPTDVGRMTVFVTDIEAYRNNLRELGAVWRERMGRHYPAMALLQVRSLVHPQAQVEIEATAVIPPPAALHGDEDAPLLA